jgi:hypothetical protein
VLLESVYASGDEPACKGRCFETVGQVTRARSNEGGLGCLPAWSTHRASASVRPVRFTAQGHAAISCTFSMLLFLGVGQRRGSMASAHGITTTMVHTTKGVCILNAVVAPAQAEGLQSAP